LPRGTQEGGDDDHPCDAARFAALWLGRCGGERFAGPAIAQACRQTDPHHLRLSGRWTHRHLRRAYGDYIPKRPADGVRREQGRRQRRHRAEQVKGAAPDGYTLM